MNAQPTRYMPGPWRTSVTTNHDAIYDHWGNRVAVIDREEFNFAQDEKRSNARLIAAAPELLAACVALIRTDDLQTAIDLARTAIAKAEGRES